MKLKVDKVAPQKKVYYSAVEEMMATQRELKDACNELKTLSLNFATAEENAHRAKAKAFAQAEGKNKESREANADKAWEEPRKTMLEAKAEKEAQLELVRSLRQILSALQTYVNTQKAEADAINFGQDLD